MTRVSSETTRRQSNIGLDIKWDGKLRLYVTVQSHYADKTCGLCGNVNNIQDGDFMNNDHAVETKMLAFANYWANNFLLTKVFT